MTQLLQEWKGGNDAALHELLPLIHSRLQEIARGHLRHERDDHSLEPGALVNELYLLLVDQRRVNWTDRAHFFAVSAQLMRRVLVDHARRRAADKRGGGMTRVTLSEGLAVQETAQVDLLLLDAALEKLEAIFPQQSRIVELRFFAGLTIDETAEALGISAATVSREWAMARAWMKRSLSKGVEER